MSTLIIVKKCLQINTGYDLRHDQQVVDQDRGDITGYFTKKTKKTKTDVEKYKSFIIIKYLYFSILFEIISIKILK